WARMLGVPFRSGALCSPGFRWYWRDAKPSRTEISMTPVLLAFLIGAVTGLRAMMAPAAVAWAANQGALDSQQSPLAFMGYRFTPWIFTLLAAVELVTDQLPTTPSRTVPPQFAARLTLGALCGATIGSSGEGWSGRCSGSSGPSSGPWAEPRRVAGWRRPSAATGRRH